MTKAQWIETFRERGLDCPAAVAAKFAAGELQPYVAARGRLPSGPFEVSSDLGEWRPYDANRDRYIGWPPLLQVAEDAEPVVAGFEEQTEAPWD